MLAHILTRNKFVTHGQKKYYADYLAGMKEYIWLIGVAQKVKKVQLV